MKNQTLISIIIPCYNHGKFLKETVMSVLDQTFQSFEIIIVNDGSTDSFTVKEMERVSRLDKRIHLINQENSGLAKARNNGIKKAIGKYIFPLDADDMIEPTMLEKCFWLLETSPEVKIAYTGVKFFGAVNILSSFVEYSFDELIRENFLTASCLFPKTCWEEVGGYDESMKSGYEDWDFWIKLGQKGYYGKQIREHLFQYRQHDVSMRLRAKEIHGELVASIRNKYHDAYFKSDLKIHYKLKKFLQRAYRYLKRKLPAFLYRRLHQIHLKLKFAGLLDPKVWLRHPIKSILRCLPYNIRLTINKKNG